MLDKAPIWKEYKYQNHSFFIPDQNKLALTGVLRYDIRGSSFVDRLRKQAYTIALHCPLSLVLKLHLFIHSSGFEGRGSSKRSCDDILDTIL